MVIPMDANVVLRLREALEESQIRVAHLEAKVAGLSEALQMAAYEIAPLRRLAEVVSLLDLMKVEAPFEDEETETAYLRALKAYEIALRFYRQSSVPQRAEAVRSHSRSITLQLAARDLERSGEAGMWPAVSWLKSEADRALDKVDTDAIAEQSQLTA